MHKSIAEDPLAVVIALIHPQASGCLQPQPEPQRPDGKFQRRANQLVERSKLVPKSIE